MHLHTCKKLLLRLTLVSQSQSDVLMVIDCGTATVCHRLEPLGTLSGAYQCP
jgi:hypothetical protein